MHWCAGTVFWVACVSECVKLLGTSYTSSTAYTSERTLTSNSSPTYGHEVFLGNNQTLVAHSFLGYTLSTFLSAHNFLFFRFSLPPPSPSQLYLARSFFCSRWPRFLHLTLFSCVAFRLYIFLSSPSLRPFSQSAARSFSRCYIYFIFFWLNEAAIKPKSGPCNCGANKCKK